MNLVDVHTIGLSQNDPSRGVVAARALAGLVSVPADVDGAGVASVVDGNALLTRLPPRSGPPTFQELFAGLKGRSAVVQLGSRAELRPSSGDPSLNRGPWRARGFAAAVVGGPQQSDEASASRDALLADLPDSLRRCVTGRGEGEAFFLAVLAELHRRGALDQVPLRVAALVDAVRAVDGRRVGPPRQMILTDGLALLHWSRGMPSAVIIATGVSEAIASTIDPVLVDSSTARERNRRYRGVFVIGGLSAGLPASSALPPGWSLMPMADDDAIIVGGDLQPRRF